MLLHFVLLWKHHISSAVCFLLQWTFYSPWTEWITPSKWKGAGPRGSFYEPIVFNYYRIILCNLVIMNLFYQNRHNSFEVNTLDTETDAPCNQLLYFFFENALLLHFVLLSRLYWNTRNSFCFLNQRTCCSPWEECIKFRICFFAGVLYPKICSNLHRTGKGWVLRQGCRQWEGGRVEGQHPLTLAFPHTHTSFSGANFFSL